MWAVKPGAPTVLIEGKRMVLWPDFPRWRESELEKAARGEGRPKDVKNAMRRKMVADSMLSEIALAEKERTVVLVEVHEQVVGEICDRLRAVLSNLPSNYLVNLERVGIDPIVAQATLELIAEDLTRCLRSSDEDDSSEEV